MRLEFRRVLFRSEYYGSTALPESRELTRATQVLLENNEIDVTQSVQNINSALDVERSYLETLLNYNLSILEYELYK